MNKILGLIATLCAIVLLSVPVEASELVTKEEITDSGTRAYFEVENPTAVLVVIKGSKGTYITPYKVSITKQSTNLIITYNHTFENEALRLEMYFVKGNNQYQYYTSMDASSSSNTTYSFNLFTEGKERNLVSSNVNVYNTDGSVFFYRQIPLTEVPTEVMEGEKVEFSTKIHSSVKLLVACAISLLALLMVLHLLPRLLRNFLK